MGIGAGEVKSLREKTGCPMMDCKKALEESGGDMDKAVEFLRKKGIAGAEKRAERPTAEGRLASSLSADSRIGAIIELGCETDFVAKSDRFKALAETVAKAACGPAPAPADTAALLGIRPAGQSKSVEEIIKQEYQTLKENMNLKQFRRFDLKPNDPGLLGIYIHFNGKIGTIVELQLSSMAQRDLEPVKSLIKDLCMQVAHSAPLGLSRDDIPAEIVERERAIAAESDDVKSKPEKIRPKIVEGKLARFFQENTLLDQEFVKEKKLTIKGLLAKVASETAGEVRIRRFARLVVGG